MKVGNKVRVVQPLNGFDCDITGVIIALYGHDRVIMRTPAGQEWALKKSQLKVLRIK